MWRQVKVPVATRGRGFHALTGRIEREVADSGLSLGLCHLFLRHTSASLCVTEGRLALGTWQGIYLWEHRTGAMRREVLVTLHGESRAPSL